MKRIHEHTKGGTIVLNILLMLLVFLLLFVVVSRTELPRLFERGTDPEELFNNTEGMFLREAKSYETFDEFYSEIYDTDTTSGITNENVAPISLTTQFYNTKPEYYDRCEQTKITINFTSPTYTAFTFNYDNHTLRYQVNVYPEVYAFTERLKRQDCYFRDGIYTEGYFHDPYNEAFMKAVALDLLALRDYYSDDELVEIATLFVQSIPYGTDESELNRYPYETIYEAQGNCLDKSVILAHLLDALGYTAYIVLGPSDNEYHALVGIVCDPQERAPNAISDAGEPLCYIETTGFFPISSNETTITVDQPLVKVATGNKVYKGVRYGPSLVKQLHAVDVAILENNNALNTTVNELSLISAAMCTTDCVICRDDNTINRRRSQTITSCTDASEYNTLVKAYNTMVITYNTIINNTLIRYHEKETLMFENQEYVKR